jgi:ATPase family associated with various cellular activities (AAA)
MRKNLFEHLQPTPAEHFKLFFYGAVLSLFHNVVQLFGSAEDAFKEFPFLVGYNNELADGGLAGVNSGKAVSLWLESLREWEKKTTEHLPIDALRRSAGLDHSSMILLTVIGLIEEDLRFGTVFETMQGTPGQHRVTPGLLNCWGRDEMNWTDARANVRRMHELGLLRVINPEAPRLEWGMEVPSPLWDALRGEQNQFPGQGFQYREPNKLVPIDQLILPTAVHEQVRAIPKLFVSGEADGVMVRSASRNGRRTLIGALARELGLGLLEVTPASANDDERVRLAGPLATALNAMPVILLDLAPQETFAVRHLSACRSPYGIVAGKQGGISGDGVEHAITINLEMPDPNLRRRHWQHACATEKLADLDGISRRFRLTAGNIHRSAQLARSYAALNKHEAITAADAQRATRSLHRQALDALAVRLSVSGDWDQLAVSEDTRRELENLVSRCRHRENLQAQIGGKASAGVRALLSGPSGTGKTLAARLLASTLQMDLYRVDLSAVVNKYIGETEKTLNLVLSRAEELDVILLLDEGDALLTQRTGVQSSNDRYANLETNFLLQRLEAESFDGILLVTTNAAERIDSAFQRRMDVVINFSPPSPPERWAIWQLHLPRAHRVDIDLLEEASARCAMTGGQIKNAALHASLLALEDGGIVTSAMVEAAIDREYRKAGGVCPLRRL